MVPQQYCLRWKHHHTNVQNMFAQLLEKERFCDVTLYCSPNFATQVPNQGTVDPDNIRGVSLRAHRVVLAACSELLGTLLGAHEAQGEPVLVIDGAEPRHLKALLDYMYTGEMNVHHSQLASLLKTAEELRIKGLTDIRWNNKDEPPDCHTGAVTTQSVKKEKPSTEVKQSESKHFDSRQVEQEVHKNKEHENSEKQEKFNVNGGPPPLIKLPMKPERTSPLKRDLSDNESNSPKRRRFASGTDYNEEDFNNIIKMERESEWQHGNMNITAERVVGWCGGGGLGSTAAGGSEDEWADAPADIGCFLRTRLTVDGDNSADEESDEGAPPSTSSSAGTSGVDIKEPPQAKSTPKLTVGPKSGPTDHRFKDVVKLNDYLRHGRRPQFWEENYVKRVMEAVRVKELEMKQAAEILGVSYGTLYGRYRDVFGCINRPYRTARDFWQAKGPSELLERLQRGEISLDAGAKALGVSASHLISYMADIAVPIPDKDFEPIPIEVDASLLKSQYAGVASKTPKKYTPPDKSACSKKIVISSVTDEDPIPVTVISTSTQEKPATVVSTTSTTTGKWPTIRVASLDTLRADPPPPSPSVRTSPSSPTPSDPLAPPGTPSPSHLMRNRPDLTIVAAKKHDFKREDTT